MIAWFYIRQVRYIWLAVLDSIKLPAKRETYFSMNLYFHPNTCTNFTFIFITVTGRCVSLMQSRWDCLSNNCNYLSWTSVSCQMGYVIMYLCDMLLPCNNNMYHGLLYISTRIGVSDMQFWSWLLVSVSVWVLMYMSNEVQVVGACMPCDLQTFVSYFQCTYKYHLYIKCYL